MKKIAVLTWFSHGRNYGQTLQAFALYAVLTRMGHACELLSYGKNGPRLSDDEIDQLTGDKRALQIKFTSFIKKHIRYSPRLYQQADVEAYLRAEGFDIVMCGSDQIWNPFMTAGFDTTYMLDLDVPCRKISYATSMVDIGFLSEYDKYPQIPALLEDFEAVSVRENTARQIVHHLTGGTVDAAVVLDPTLLLTQAEWSREVELPPAAETEKYIFCYMFHLDEAQKELLRQTARRYCCSTVIFSDILKSGDPTLEGLQGKVEKTASIERFLSLIRNAEAVITDSYHGTIFSIQFEKPFLALESASEGRGAAEKGHPRNIDRLATLLDKAGLMDRLLSSDLCAAQRIEPISFEQVNARLAQERERSLNWLKNAID